VRGMVAVEGGGVIKGRGRAMAERRGEISDGYFGGFMEIRMKTRVVWNR
jgi:hypothetical protein